MARAHGLRPFLTSCFPAFKMRIDGSRFMDRASLLRLRFTRFRLYLQLIFVP
jgi:hypothetical protein